MREGPIWALATAFDQRGFYGLSHYEYRKIQKWKGGYGASPTDKGQGGSVGQREAIFEAGVFADPIMAFTYRRPEAAFYQWPRVVSVPLFTS